MYCFEKDGFGCVYFVGFLWVVGWGYFMVVEMDVDGFYLVVSFLVMVEVFDFDFECGVVIGLCWVLGGRVVDWLFVCWLFSCIVNVYVCWVFCIFVYDIIGGYCVYCLSVVVGFDVEEIDFWGYCF